LEDIAAIGTDDAATTTASAKQKYATQAVDILTKKVHKGSYA